MAIFYDNPFHPVDPKTAGGTAEIIVKRALEELSDDYRVFLNFEATNEVGRTLGEFDTVVVTPTGAVVVLEVKSGDLKENDTGDLTRSYWGETKNISAQVASQGRLVRTRIKNHFPDCRLRFRQFIVLPNGKVKSVTSFNNPGRIVIDTKELPHLVERIREIDRLEIREGKNLTAEEIVQFFKGEIEVAPNISALAYGHDAIGERDSRGLAKWVPKIETVVPVIEVEAPAGGGKTQLAVSLLRQAIARGEKAIYVGFNRNNIERLRKSPIASKLWFIGTWHELARELTRDETDPAKLTLEEKSAWFEKISSNLCRVLENSENRFDLIIADGAEDFEVDWISALANALTDTGHLYTLRDNFLYSSYERPEFDPEDHIVIRSSESARISKEYANDMIQLGIVSADFTGNPAINDIKYDFIEVKDGNFKLATAKALEKALQSFKAEQIAVLSAHGLSSSQILKKDGILNLKFKKPSGIFNEQGDMVFTEGEIFLDTLRRFKGLHSPYVIITEWDYEEFSEKEKSLLYLAMTRCLMKVDILMSTASLEAIIKSMDDN